MRIKKIEIENYRCYSNNNFCLGDDVTIFIGKNGTGKSSVISALRKGLTFIFSNVKNKENKENKVNEFKRNHALNIEGFSDTDTTFKEDKGGYQWPTKIKYQLYQEYLPYEITWEFLKKGKGGRLLPTLYSGAQRYFISVNKNERLWPLFAFYGDDFPHIENASRCKSYNKILLKHLNIPRDYGYISWNESLNLFNTWCNRYKFIANKYERESLHLENIVSNLMRLNELLINVQGDPIKYASISTEIRKLESRKAALLDIFNNETKSLEIERNFVDKILISFFNQNDEGVENDLLNLYKIEIGRDTKNDYLRFRFGLDVLSKEGLYTESTLPMGYKRLLSIVMDLAYRLYILGFKDESIFKGIAFIDEVELHLHPGLQKVIIDRFRKVFPGLQFVFTTHSPLIISNLNIDSHKTKVIKLEKEGDKYFHTDLKNNYGLDYNSTLFNVMDVSPSNSQIDSLITAYLFAQKESKEDGRDEILSFLLSEINKAFDNELPQYLVEKLGLR